MIDLEKTLSDLISIPSVNPMGQSDSQSIFPRGPDAAIIAEPTSLDIVVTHKGTARWRYRTSGRAAHSSQPDLGTSAIYRMGHVLKALENYGREVCASLPSHPLCGRSALSVGLIAGGRGINAVPDECSIVIDRRFLPTEDSNAAYQQVIDHIKSFPEIDFDVDHEVLFSIFQPRSVDLEISRSVVDRYTGSV